VVTPRRPFSTRPCPRWCTQERDVTNTAALLDEQLKMFSEMGFCHGRLGYATRGMKEIRRATDRYLGVHVDDASKAEATTRDDTASEATATHSSATTGASAASAASAADGGGGGGGGGGGDDPAANYARLSAAIDALAATNETDLLKVTKKILLEQRVHATPFSPIFSRCLNVLAGRRGGDDRASETAATVSRGRAHVPHRARGTYYLTYRAPCGLPPRLRAQPTNQIHNAPLTPFCPSPPSFCVVDRPLCASQTTCVALRWRAGRGSYSSRWDC